MPRGPTHHETHSFHPQRFDEANHQHRGNRGTNQHPGVFSSASPSVQVSAQNGNDASTSASAELRATDGESHESVTLQEKGMDEEEAQDPG
ncbi:hypothetical protein CKAH01_06918 [Colletotrichum kahawae]|uniref:Uncharacterized protein n=1 Tax=Colletotrichum kahawae TaxID=34407 RepID=A0AAE0D382_COLKA|nr:hypothetical protein CKAH01_06918 [Colletotrichum kahawae]